MNPFEFAILFSEITQNEKNEIFVDQKARVVMSPLQAKVFTLLMAKNLHDYESRFGEIRMPEGLMAQTSAAEAEP